MPNSSVRGKLLLVLASNPIPPRTGSAIVAYNSIRGLAKNFSLHLICLDTPKESAELRGLVDEVEFAAPQRASGLFVKLRKIVRMLSGKPAVLAAYESARMRELVAAAVARTKYDAIVMFEMYAVQYCPPSEYPKVLVNVENPQAIHLRRLLRLPVWSAWERVKFRLQTFLTERYERRTLSRLGKVLLLSESDAAEMRESGPYDNIGCVTYGVVPPPAAEVPGRAARSENAIIFSGNMHHPANVDAGVYFLRSIFPAVVKGRPGVVLWIVGADPDARIREAAAGFGASVVITGRVDNVSDYLKKALVSVCPVRQKIGVQTKILEAMSWGTPVVTTSAGNKGTAARSGSELWVEDEPEKFAARVVELLRGDGWQGFSEQGRRLVAERFTWERSAAEIEAHIRSLPAAAS